jgi:hypothetical protein
MNSKAYIRMTTALGLKFGPVRKGVTPKRILEFVLQDMTRIKDDNVLTTDPEAIEYIKGMWQAYRNVAHFIAPVTNMNGPVSPVPAASKAGAAAQLVNAVTH